jgi:hypothetical protein
MIHSTTIILPLWFQTLEKLKLEAQKMPRDVSTRWNSTFNMLQFALQYRPAIDDIAGNKNTNLQQYELDGDEWRIAQQLYDTLKVSVFLPLNFQSPCSAELILSWSRSSRTLRFSFHAQHLTLLRCDRVTGGLGLFSLVIPFNSNFYSFLSSNN